jgi:hypothetical protein
MTTIIIITLPKKPNQPHPTAQVAGDSMPIADIQAALIEAANNIQAPVIPIVG